MLFFVENSPDDMARMHIGVKRATPEAIRRWKVDSAADKADVHQRHGEQRVRFTETLFAPTSRCACSRSEFGCADDLRDISQEIRERMGPSLAIALPTFVLSLVVSDQLRALLLVFFRATWLDFWRGAVRRDDVDSSLFYIIGGQWLVSAVGIGADLGHAPGLDAARFWSCRC